MKRFPLGRKLILAGTMTMAVFIARTFAQDKHHDDEKPTNLKVLPKDIGEDQLHHLMRDYSHSLGVRCGFCHEGKQLPDGKMSLDFASDAKPEKEIARKMILMTEAINAKYISEIGDHKLEQITCVTCHMGSTKPLVMVDSLVKPSGEKRN